MRALRLLLSGWFLFVFAALAVADDKKKPPAKDDKKDTKEFKEKIVGTWEVVEDFSYKKGTLITFTKDGKLNFRPPGEKKGADGTYKLDGDQLTLAWKTFSTPALTVNKITDEELLTSVAGGKQKWKGNSAPFRRDAKSLEREPSPCHSSLCSHGRLLCAR